MAYCAAPRQIPQESSSSPPAPTTSSPVPSSSDASSAQQSDQSQAQEWYAGGTLHQATALDWQQASDRNKLATCADFISSLWSKGSLAPELQNQIQSVNDIRPLAEELVRQMNDAMEPDPDPELNRNMFANQDVSTIAVSVMLLMGWIN